MNEYLQRLHAEHKARQLKFAAPVIQVKRKFIDGPGIKFIISQTADYYGYSYSVIKNSRNRVVTGYRWLIFYFCRKILNYSFNKIAKNFKCNHSVIWRGVNKFEEMLLLNPRLELDLQAVRMKISRAYNCG